MTQGEIAAWLLLTSADADASWLGNHSSKSTRRALRIGSKQLSLPPCDVAMNPASAQVIVWLCSPTDEIVRSLGFASLVLFKPLIGVLLACGELRIRWSELLGAEPIIELLRLADEGGQNVQAELVPDWSSEDALFHPGLALVYALLSRHCSFLAMRLLQRFDKQEVQGMYRYLASIDVEAFASRESLIFGFERRWNGDDYKIEGVAGTY